MITKHKVLLVLGTIFFIITILFVGQYHDPQDGDRTFFIKYKPTLKQFYYSPLANKNLLSGKHSLQEYMEEEAFQEFIVNQQLLKTVNGCFWVPITLIQLTLTFLICGLFSLYASTHLKYWQLIAHFLINFAVTTLGVINILLRDTHTTTLISSFVIFTTNLLTVIVLYKINHALVKVNP